MREAVLATLAWGGICRTEYAIASQSRQACAAHSPDTAFILIPFDSHAVKPYLVSLAIGILVGALYALMRVRSPAPPVVALAGLLGMLIGEQGLGFALTLLRQPPVANVDVVSPASTSAPDQPPGSRHAP